MLGAGLLYTLLYLVIFGLIVGLVFYLLKFIPEPPQSIVRVCMIVVVVIFAILWLISLLPAIGPGLPFPYHR